ncbi:MAG TPA: YrrS family protein [Bacillales bacterium]
MSDLQTGPSRMGERGRKRKQNRLMNLLIGIVCILILIVGGTIFFGGSGQSNQAANESTTNTNGSNNNGGDNGSNTAASGNADQDQSGNDNAKSDQNGTDATGTAAEDKQQSGNTENQQQQEDSKQDKTSDSKKDGKKQDQDKKSAGGPDGPWKPIGTEQEPPHVSSYDRGSVDWNEKVKALLYATGLTGLNEDQYILWRLANGGGPQQSVGKISTNAKPHEWYIVHLQWVKNKGWKPTSVEKVYKEDLPS